MRHSRHSGPCALALIAILAVLPACKTFDDESDTDKSKQADSSAHNQNIASVKGADLIPLKERTFSILYTEGDLKDKTVAVTVSKGEKGQWMEKAPDVRVQYYGEVEGGVGMSREDDFGEGVTINYEPPFVLLPKSLAADKPFEGTTKMTVLNLKSGTPKASGECKYKVELVKKEKIETPAGAFDAILIKTTRDIKLDLANVQVTVLTWHVPEKGMVASQVNQKTQALGLFGSEKAEAWKLAK